MSQSEKNDYTLTLEGASKLIAKSERTVQRYVKAGRLSQKYVMGPKGKEARLSKSEVIDLAHDTSSGIGAAPGDSPDSASRAGTKAGTEQVTLNIMELLQRHEQAMYRLGQLEEKSRQVLAIEERAQSLAERNTQLTTEAEKQLQQTGILEEKLLRFEREFKRPLSFTERLTGRRRV